MGWPPLRWSPLVIFFARTAPKRDTPNSLSGRPETVVEADQSQPLKL